MKFWDPWKLFISVRKLPNNAHTDGQDLLRAFNELFSLRKKCPYAEIFWSVFSRIRIEYGEIHRISPCLVQMRENTDQYNSEYEYIWRRDLFTVFYIKCSVKQYCVAKVLLAIWETFFYESTCNYNSNKFSYKFLFLCLLSFHKNQKRESIFQQVESMVTKIFVFCIASRAVLQRYAQFSRLLYRNFLTCYSFAYYSSMLY